MIDEELKKIKYKKNLAILLISGSIFMLIKYSLKPDFDKHGYNNYIICGSLIVVIFCGIMGLRNSLRKEKEFKNQE